MGRGGQRGRPLHGCPPPFWADEPVGSQMYSCPLPMPARSISPKPYDAGTISPTSQRGKTKAERSEFPQCAKGRPRIRTQALWL